MLQWGEGPARFHHTAISHFEVNGSAETVDSDRIPDQSALFVRKNASARRRSHVRGEPGAQQSHGPAAGGAIRFAFQYQSRPNWDAYTNLLEFARAVRRDVSAMRPRNLIDIQSFLWVQGSDEYE
jgi:hypothetical protein